MKTKATALCAKSRRAVDGGVSRVQKTLICAHAPTKNARKLVDKSAFDTPELEGLRREKPRHSDLQWPCWPHAKQMSPGFALLAVKGRELDLKLGWRWPVNEVLVAEGWNYLFVDFPFCWWHSLRLRRSLCSARRLRFSSSEPLANSSDKYSLTKS